MRALNQTVIVDGPTLRRVLGDPTVNTRAAIPREWIRILRLAGPLKLFRKRPSR